ALLDAETGRIHPLSVSTGFTVPREDARLERDRKSFQGRRAISGGNTWHASRNGAKDGDVARPRARPRPGANPPAGAARYCSVPRAGRLMAPRSSATDAAVPGTEVGAAVLGRSPAPRGDSLRVEAEGDGGETGRGVEGDVKVRGAEDEEVVIGHREIGQLNGDMNGDGVGRGGLGEHTDLVMEAIVLNGSHRDPVSEEEAGEEDTEEHLEADCVEIEEEEHGGEDLTGQFNLESQGQLFGREGRQLTAVKAPEIVERVKELIPEGHQLNGDGQEGGQSEGEEETDAGTGGLGGTSQGGVTGGGPTQYMLEMEGQEPHPKSEGPGGDKALSNGAPDGGTADEEADWVPGENRIPETLGAAIEEMSERRLPGSREQVPEQCERQAALEESGTPEGADVKAGKGLSSDASEEHSTGEASQLAEVSEELPGRETGERASGEDTCEVAEGKEDPTSGSGHVAWKGEGPATGGSLAGLTFDPTSKGGLLGDGAGENALEKMLQLSEEAQDDTMAVEDSGMPGGANSLSGVETLVDTTEDPSSAEEPAISERSDDAAVIAGLFGDRENGTDEDSAARKDPEEFQFQELPCERGTPQTEEATPEAPAGGADREPELGRRPLGEAEEQEREREWMEIEGEECQNSELETGAGPGAGAPSDAEDAAGDGTTVPGAVPDLQTERDTPVSEQDKRLGKRWSEEEQAEECAISEVAGGPETQEEDGIPREEDRVEGVGKPEGDEKKVAAADEDREVKIATPGEAMERAEDNEIAATEEVPDEVEDVCQSLAGRPSDAPSGSTENGRSPALGEASSGCEERKEMEEEGAASSSVPEGGVGQSGGEESLLLCAAPPRNEDGSAEELPSWSLFEDLAQTPRGVDGTAEVDQESSPQDSQEVTFDPRWMMEGGEDLPHRQPIEDLSNEESNLTTAENFISEPGESANSNGEDTSARFYTELDFGGAVNLREDQDEILVTMPGGTQTPMSVDIVEDATPNLQAKSTPSDVDSSATSEDEGSPNASQMVEPSAEVFEGEGENPELLPSAVPSHNNSNRVMVADEEKLQTVEEGCESLNTFQGGENVMGSPERAGDLNQGSAEERNCQTVEEGIESGMGEEPARASQGELAQSTDPEETDDSQRGPREEAERNSFNESQRGTFNGDDFYRNGDIAVDAADTMGDGDEVGEPGERVNVFAEEVLRESRALQALREELENDGGKMEQVEDGFDAPYVRTTLYETQPIAEEIDDKELSAMDTSQRIFTQSGEEGATVDLTPPATLVTPSPETGGRGLKIQPSAASRTPAGPAHELNGVGAEAPGVTAKGEGAAAEALAAAYRYWSSEDE
ncbi:hypothetical protein scyTo_0022681, partial [Scyliorhinus torazame]|nr:hypothetical protein [Scyliorhinus torazame]